jgi:hypothetical protein
MVKIMTLALVLGLVLWIFFYLPKRLRPGGGARFRYIVFTVLALIFAAVLLKVFV